MAPSSTATFGKGDFHLFFLTIECPTITKMIWSLFLCCNYVFVQVVQRSSPFVILFGNCSKISPEERAILWGNFISSKEVAHWSLWVLCSCSIIGCTFTATLTHVISLLQSFLHEKFLKMKNLSNSTFILNYSDWD